MAITEFKKQSDIEKRLKLLRQQVYGRETVSSIKYQVSSEETEKNKIPHNTKYLIPNTDTVYLYQDLFKIFTLSALAIGIQLILFILTRNHILNLVF